MSATGLLSKGIYLSYSVKGADSYTRLTDLQEMPQLGNSPNMVDVTTLDDGAYRNIKGLKQYDAMEFKFLYANDSESDSYRILRGLEDTEDFYDWKVTFPDKTEFKFVGQVSTFIDSASVDSPITFTATIALNSDIDVVNPA